MRERNDSLRTDSLLSTFYPSVQQPVVAEKPADRQISSFDITALS
jgi:hypothetical protein